MKKILVTLFFAVIAKGFAFAQMTPADCGDGNVYQVTSSGTTTPSTLWVYNPVLGTRTSLGALPDFVNGIGYNPVDSYLWGNIAGNTIVKIGTDATWETYTIPNLPSSTTPLNTGTISSDGYYYLTTTSSNVYYTIDLDPSRSTYLQLVDPTAGYVLDNTAPFGTAMSPTRDISDWAYNPVDGMLYAMINTDAFNQYHLMILDPTTGVSTLSTSAITGGDIEGSDYGGVYFDSEGNFYVIRNASGHFYRINTTTLTATRISGLSVSFTEYNDAGACLAAPPIRTDLGDAPDSYGTLFNSSGAVHIVSNNLMIGSVVDYEDDGFPSLDANGDDTNQSPDDEDGVTTIPSMICNATSYSITVAVTNTSGAPAVLAGWIDFNGDGIFQNTERAEVSVADGQTSAVLSWSGLSGIAAGSSYMRFRIAADGNEILNATGAAATGEVEDYGITIAPSLSGNVFDDGNGLNDSQVNGTPISTADGTQLYVSLYSGATLIATVPVEADGTYQFENVTLGTTYTIVLGTNAVANVTSPFGGSGTGGWESVGEDCCDNTGGDGSPDGSLTITIGAINTNANFGIEQQPDSDDLTTTIPQPTTNDIITLNGIGTNPPLLAGSDLEDGIYSGASGTVASPVGVIITSLPANGVLNYNGNPVTVGQTIADPSLLTIVLTGTGYTSVSFDYAYVDAAGVVDPTPATYTVNWSGSLPVTLVDFEVSKSELQVRVSWTTSSETNSSYFDIERSIDAHTWNVIGKVSAKENRDGLTQYDFTDATPAQSINYYRLKMVDQDQSFAYSKIRSISFGGVNLRMYPNPVTSELHIDNVDFNQIQKVGLYTIAGNAVYENTGVIKQTIDVSRFNSGTYVLTITLKNGEKISKTVVKN